MRFLLNLIVIPVGLIFMALIGSFFGVIVDIIPVIGNAIRVDFASTPALMAWLFMGALIFGALSGNSPKEAIEGEAE